MAGLHSDKAVLLETGPGPQSHCRAGSGAMATATLSRPQRCRDSKGAVFASCSGSLVASWKPLDSDEGGAWRSWRALQESGLLTIHGFSRAVSRCFICYVATWLI